VQETLPQAHAERSQGIDLGLRLEAFGHDRDPHLIRERDERL
jgi:hypothetical protein